MLTFMLAAMFTLLHLSWWKDKLVLFGSLAQIWGPCYDEAAVSSLWAKAGGQDVTETQIQQTQQLCITPQKIIKTVSCFKARCLQNRLMHLFCHTDEIWLLSCCNTASIKKKEFSLVISMPGSTVLGSGVLPSSSPLISEWKRRLY